MRYMPSRSDRNWVEQFTPKQVARAIGVSDASLKRWCDRGVLHSVRTAGGHRRIPLPGIIQFLQSHGHEMVRPDLLGLPPSSGSGRTVIGRSLEHAVEALVGGDELRFQRVLLDLHLRGHKLSELCDQVIAPAFAEIGTRWEHGSLEVYQERRASEICVRALHRFETLLPPPRDDARLAIGGSPAGDPYVLPTLVTEVALRESGWRAESLGNNLPTATLAAAIQHLRPRLAWVSVSWLADAEAFVADYQHIRAAAASAGACLVLGGNGLSQVILSRLSGHAYCRNLGELLGIVRTLVHN